MDAASYILERQVLWARRRGISLQGSDGEKGEPTYTPALEDNLFEPLSPEARHEYEQGDGQEPRRNMRAVHSSSALVCNIFAYWKRLNDPAAMAKACGLPTDGVSSLRFEAKLPIANALDRQKFPRDPNLDVLISADAVSGARVTAVECKFREPYSNRGHAGLSPRYPEERGFWVDLPRCRALAERVSPADQEFKHLHVAQLLKHVLGLQHAFGRNGFRLLYLWYDVPAREGNTHRQEVGRFAEILCADGLEFQSLTYQELFLRLARHQRDGHQTYVDYLIERYL